jgi:hypothetical protein
MRAKLRSVAVLLSGGYLALFLLAAGLALYEVVFHTARSALASVPAILITQPWSMMWLPLLDQFGVIAWYDRFAGTPWLFGTLAMLALFPAALPNAAILYCIGWVIDRQRVRR